MLKYLNGQEKERCRSLWEEAFPEDSQSFVDYYFKEKMKDNRVLACDEDGRIVSMLHRNPYRIYMRGAEYTCDYIVGVSTAVSERNKGHMRNLILTVLRDMQEERMPFTFLMPARETLYLPYDFRYIFDQPRWVLGYGPEIRKVRWTGGRLAGDLAEWQNAWLKRQYEVFALRDEDYLNRMQKELESEAGIVQLVYDGDWFVGMESEWGLKEFIYGGALPDPGTEKAGDHGQDRLSAGVFEADPVVGGLPGGRDHGGDRRQRLICSPEPGGMEVAFDEERLRGSPGIAVYSQGKDDRISDCGADPVAVWIFGAESGGGDSVWGGYRTLSRRILR